MAKTENSQPVGQELPTQQTQTGSTSVPQPPAGFNPNILLTEFNNLTGLVMRSINNPGEIGNIFSSLMGTLPAVQVPSPNTNLNNQ